jgi:hypothetical protein
MRKLVANGGPGSVKIFIGAGAVLATRSVSTAESAGGFAQQKISEPGWLARPGQVAYALETFGHDERVAPGRGRHGSRTSGLKDVDSGCCRQKWLMFRAPYSIFPSRFMMHESEAVAHDSRRVSPEKTLHRM